MDGWIGGRWHVDGKDLIRERAQDVEAILDRNKALQNEPQKTSETLGHHLASIPLIIVEKWRNEEGADILKMGQQELQRFLRRKLNDPDWQYLKTR